MEGNVNRIINHHVVIWSESAKEIYRVRTNSSQFPNSSIIDQLVMSVSVYKSRVDRSLHLPYFHIDTNCYEVGFN
jgi:Sec7-like guanine-nucleotide exchange factor